MGGSALGSGGELGDPLHQAGLAVGRLVLVDHALRGGHVEPLHRQAQGIGARVGARLGGLHRSLHARLELGAHRLVAEAPTLVLPIALDLALDVRHEGKRVAGARLRSPPDMTKPRIAVAPKPFPWAVEQVEAAGAEVVPPEQAEALVWLHPKDVASLQEVLARGPGIRWVQLPWAGVEDFARSGIFDDDRVWTCAKGVYAEPVAEH